MKTKKRVRSKHTELTTQDRMGMTEGLVAVLRTIAQGQFTDGRRDEHDMWVGIDAVAEEIGKHLQVIWDENVKQSWKISELRDPKRIAELKTIMGSDIPDTSRLGVQ
jgi:hypothetical protein